MLKKFLSNFLGINGEEGEDSKSVTPFVSQPPGEAFESIFKEFVRPAFKGLGFKRKNQHFARHINDIVQVANVQRSQWNSSDCLRFTFNIGIYSDKIRSITSANLPSVTFPKVVDSFLTTRLGMLSHKHDHWYELKEGRDLAFVSKQVQSDFQNHLIPFFEEHSALKDFVVIYDIDERKSPFFISDYMRAVFYLAIGQLDKGRPLILKMYNEAIIPHASTMTVNYPDGRSDVVPSPPKVNQHYVDSVKSLAIPYGVDL